MRWNAGLGSGFPLKLSSYFEILFYSLFVCLLFILHTSRCVLIIYNPVLLTVDFPTANGNSKTCLFLSFLYTFYTIRRVLLFRNSPSIITFLLVVVLLLVF